METKYFYMLMKLAEKASKNNEVPISALIVKNDKILSKAYNKRNENKVVTEHAEIIAIKKASKKIKDWRLDECDLYVTLKPCSMCESCINQARIRNVYYLLDKPLQKKEYYKSVYTKIQEQMFEDYYKNLLKEFFLKKRDK